MSALDEITPQHRAGLGFKGINAPTWTSGSNENPLE